MATTPADRTAYHKPNEPITVKELPYVVLGLVIFFGLPMLLFWIFTPDSIRYPALYGALNSVPRSHVYVDKQPTDCDWGHAPIGDKGCHYTKSVQVIHNDSGRATDVYITWEKVPE